VLVLRRLDLDRVLDVYRYDGVITFNLEVAGIDIVIGGVGSKTLVPPFNLGRFLRLFHRLAHYLKKKE